MSFWPSSIEHSLAGIIVSMLLVGSGCGLLEAACHPFVALIGPQDYAEVRINILQGIQAVGGLLMLLIETTQLYASIGIQSYSTLFNIQWVFLACGFTSFIIAGIFCCVNLPELKEYEPSFKVSSYMLFCGRYRTSFILALVAMFFYVGGQEVTTLYSRKYLVYGIKDDDATALKSEKGAQALFAIGRFLGAALMLTFRPTAVLFFYILGLVATSAICLAANGALANASYNFNLFFQSISFPTIFIISLRGTGADILTASSYLTSTVSGAAVVSSLYWVIEKSKGDKFAVCVLCMAVFSVMILHPVYITLSRSERERTKRVDRSVCEEDGREVVGGGSGRWVEGTLRCAGMCGARRTRKRTDGVVGFGNFSTTEPGSEGT